MTVSARDFALLLTLVLTFAGSPGSAQSSEPEASSEAGKKEEAPPAASDNEDEADVELQNESSEEIVAGQGEAEELVIEEEDLFTADGEAGDAGVGEAAPLPPLELDVISIYGKKLDLSRLAGSAHEIDEEKLERYEYDNVERAVQKVPGVYVRSEDGFGLRPNIGLRGASSDRSAKVTLLEDGILFAPAPYSAPAAYYFPLLTRMEGIEVFKGPASIRYGPNTIGGALNFRTAAVPASGSHGLIDLAAGQYEYGKAHGRVAHGSERWGFLLEGVRLQSRGFKNLPDPDTDTGFDKNEVMGKFRWNSDPGAEVFHRLQLKVTYSDERSNETYLGLTQADFDDAPYQRYAATQLGSMKNDRTSAVLTYSLAVGQNINASISAYRHDFDRAWRKLNDIRSATQPSLILNAINGGNDVALAVLRGDRDSVDEGLVLAIGTNDRRFVSQGITGKVEVELNHGFVSQRIEAGVRYHFDEIRRRHDEGEYAMENRVVVPTDDFALALTTRNRARTNAIAAYVSDEVGIGKNFALTPGVRVEHVRGWFRSLAHNGEVAGDPIEGARTTLIPGFGAFYRLSDSFGALAGVHRGFSPVAPGQPDAVVPETSVNYEAGIRFEAGAWKAEAIGFLSDYDNVLGTCTGSGSSCRNEDLGKQYNGGAVRIVGGEFAGSGRAPLGEGLALLLDSSITATRTEFLEGFESEFPLFGRVLRGDELPYVPRVQGSFAAGLEMGKVEFFTSLNYVDSMLDAAGRRGRERETDAALIVDLAARLAVTAADEVYLNVDNAFGTNYVASFRPFGARPGKPTHFKVGYRHHFN